MSKRRHVRTLTERAEWLEASIEAGAGSPGALGHREGEARALRWALPILADLAERDGEEARNVHRQRAESELVACAARAIVAVLDLGDRDGYDQLMAGAPSRVANAVEGRRFGTALPQAAP